MGCRVILEEGASGEGSPGFTGHTMDKRLRELGSQLQKERDYQYREV